MRRPRRRAMSPQVRVSVPLLGALLLAACGVANDEVGSGVTGEDAPLTSTEVLVSPTHEPTPTFIVGTVTPAIPSPLMPSPTYVDATPDPAEPVCVYIAPAMAREPPPPANYVEPGVLVVRGRVVDVLPARWTTPDGSRPANAHDAMPDTASITTPVLLELDGPPIVNSTGTTIDGPTMVVLLTKGEVGLDCFDSGVPWNHLDVGEEVLLVLGDKPLGMRPGGTVTTEHGPGWWVDARWTLSEGGVAVRAWPSGVEPEQTADVIDAFERAAERLLGAPTAPTAVP